MKISLEGFLLLNFAVDFLVLYLAGRGIWFFNPVRLTFASAFGALYAVADVLWGGCGATRAVAFPVMLLIAFPVHALGSFLKAMAMAAVAAVLIAGGVLAVQKWLPAVHMSLAVGGLLAFAMMAAVRSLSALPRACRIRVRVSYGGSCAEFDALVDTGNLLVEPLSAIPVMIADAKALGERFVKRTHRNANSRTVAYTTVAGEGELLCIRADAIEIRDGREWADAPDMWLGVYPGKIRSGVHALVPGCAVRK